MGCRLIVDLLCQGCNMICCQTFELEKKVMKEIMNPVWMDKISHPLFIVIFLISKCY